MIPHFYTAIPGWCDFEALYRDQVARIPAGGHIVEVGSFLGKSTAFLAVEIANSGKRITFDACDTWQGVRREQFCDPEAHELQRGAIALHGSLKTACAHNLQLVQDWVTLIEADSLLQASRYATESLDFVFLDDDHAAPHVYAELVMWWPKIKPGGVLAGHDWDWPGVAAAVGQWAVAMGLPVRPTGRTWVLEKPLPRESWTVPEAERVCLVAVCCNERTVDRETVKSLAAVAWGQRVTAAARAHGFADIRFAWFDRYVRVDNLRDEAALVALQTGCSHLLFLDADNTWPPDLLMQMLRHHHRGIVGGLYFLKNWPHNPVALRGGVWDPLNRQVDYTYDLAALETPALRREQLIGMGCTLIPVEVFRRFPRPWFAYQDNASGFAVLTEDVAFCQRAAAAGCPIWLDPSIVCGHRSVQTITPAWCQRAQVERGLIERDVCAEAAQEGADGVVRPVSG